MRSQVPWGLIGAIITVLGVESFIMGRELDLIRPERYEWRLARRAADKKSQGCDVLCFGTSMVKQGVFPAIIERRTGLRTYNFAVCAGRTESSYYLLRRALEAGARPSAILMDVHP